MNIRFRRWAFEVYRRALHITRLPDPDCRDCGGSGGIETGGGYVLDYHWLPDIEPCDCWDPAPVVRIPLWFRRTESVPF